jgi:Na+/melibiose symporter-like transporter
VPLATLGLLLGAGRVLDAVDDPAIGHWSDVTRSRWGRRLPFVVAGTPPLALLFVLVWLPPGAGVVGCAGGGHGGRPVASGGPGERTRP